MFMYYYRILWFKYCLLTKNFYFNSILSNYKYL